MKNKGSMNKDHLIGKRIAGYLLRRKLGAGAFG